MSDSQFTDRKTRIPLNTSIKTGVIQYQTEAIDDQNARAVQNTGLYVGGALTNLYEQENTYDLTGFNYETEDNHTISSVSPGSGENRKVYLDGTELGEVSRWGVVQRLAFVGDDVCIDSSDGSILVARYSVTDTAIIVICDQYSPNGTFLDSHTDTYSTGSALKPVAFGIVRGEHATFGNCRYIVWQPGSPEGTFYLLIAGSRIPISAGSVYFCEISNNNISAWEIYGTTTLGPQVLVWQNGRMQGDSPVPYTSQVFLLDFDAIDVVGDYVAFYVQPTEISAGVWRFVFTPGANAGDSIVGAAYLGDSGPGATFSSTLVGIASLDSGTSTIGAAPGMLEMKGTDSSTDYIYQYPDWTGVVARQLLPAVGGFFGLPQGFLNYFPGHQTTIEPWEVVFRIGVTSAGAGPQDYTPAFICACQPELYPPTFRFPGSMGTLLCEVGELNAAYTPMVQRYVDGSDVTFYLLYQTPSKEYRVVVVADVDVTAPELPIQKIDVSLYKINTISAANLVDTRSQTLELGSIAYNGSIAFGVLSIAETPANTIFQIAGRYCNSLDAPIVPTGSLSNKIVFPASAVIPPYNLRGNRAEINQYADAGTGIEYICSYPSFYSYGGSGPYVDPSLIGATYAPFSALPIPMGLRYGDRFAVSQNKILLLDWYYTDPSGNQHASDAYIIGNEIPGYHIAFTLYGQVYIFDGDAIWSATIVNNQYQTREYVCQASGLSYLASSAQLIFFLSTYDNSLWSFGGARNVTKVEDFNQYPEITQGSFSNRDSLLLLETSDTFLWVRDTGITATLRKPNQSSLRIYSTEGGMKIGNDTYSWQYSFQPLSGSTVVPLTWQGAYYGQQAMRQTVWTTYYVTVYSTTKTAVMIRATVHSYTANSYDEDIHTITINPGDYQDSGVCVLKIMPQKARAIAMSLELSADDKINILDVVGVVNDGGDDTVSSRSA